MKKIIEKIKYFLFKYENLIMWIFCALVSAFMLGALLSKEITYDLSFIQNDIEKVDTLQIDSIRYKN